MKSAWVIAVVGLITLGPVPTFAAQSADLCSLLTKAEVQQAFSDVEQGVPDRELEAQGIRRCRWSYTGGHILVLEGDEITDSPKDEAVGWMEMFVDPLRGNAVRQMRFETLQGVGDSAVVAVERKDSSKGFIADGAVLVMRRGKRQISVIAPALAQRDRAEALRILSNWGKAIAKRSD